MAKFRVAAFMGVWKVGSVKCLCDVALDCRPSFVLNRMALATQPHDLQPVFSRVPCEMVRFDFSSENAADRADVRLLELSCGDGAPYSDVRLEPFRVSPVSRIRLRSVVLTVPRSPQRFIVRPTPRAPAGQ